MSKPIFDPAYWKDRLERCVPLHHAVFVCPEERWRRIEAKHRSILAEKISPSDSILDVGCAWGRLLDLLPEGWAGSYLGIDISPDFVEMARLRHPGDLFAVMDVRDVSPLIKADWAVMISIRPMIKREVGGETWDLIERKLMEVSKRQLYLEYDEHDPGEVIESFPRLAGERASKT